MNRVNFYHISLYLIFSIFINGCSLVPEFPYELIGEKIEKQYFQIDGKSHFRNNKMELYAYEGKIDIENLKLLCLVKRQLWESDAMYYLVLFDKKENANYPTRGGFGGHYGLDDKMSKHIRAYYTYVGLNGYSKLCIYNKNSLESICQEYEIKR